MFKEKRIKTIFCDKCNAELTIDLINDPKEVWAEPCVRFCKKCANVMYKDYKHGDRATFICNGCDFKKEDITRDEFVSIHDIDKCQSVLSLFLV